MIVLKKRESAARSHTEGPELYARLLDPHLSSTERAKDIAESKWPWLKAFTLIILVSVLLWGATIFGISFLLKLF
jgi:hypothetical protein